MKLNGKVAVVTGSGSGIGKSIVMGMANKGALVVVADINIEGMNEVVADIKKRGGVAISCRTDVTNRSEVRKLMKFTAKKFGKIDILVNNAGVTRHQHFSKMTDEDWDIVLAVDLKGVFNCIQAVADYMMHHQYGKIVNISSVSGTGVSSNQGANSNYAAAKAGVIQLTKTFARELGPYGVNVNSVAPGFVLTPLSSTRRSKKEIEKHINVRKKQTVLNRVGQPEDIANAVIFLVSDEAGYITGQVLCVDGGRTDRM
jgi:NAD(P)-dependent dehydrogenase (short-subunit alcohol dehydrogenase family)